MKKTRFSLNVFSVLVLLAFGFTLSQAQATRTWVSGVGDDVNPCSRTAPCKTWAGAISKTAANGEIDALDPGGFGQVTITKGITLDGNNIGSILATGTSAITINIASPAAGDNQLVIIRNMSINGVGSAGGGTTGVRVLAAVSVAIEHCNIFGFTNSPGRGVGDERTVANGTLYVTDTVIQNSTNGIVIAPSTGNSGVRATIDRDRVVNNTTFGISATATSKVNVNNCVVSGNGSAGFDVESSAFMNIESSLSTVNVNGLSVLTGGIAEISNVNITLNSVGISNSGVIRSFGNNKVDSNATNVSGNAIMGPGSGGPSQI